MKAGWVNGQDQDHRRNTTRWVHSRFVSLVSTVWLRRWTSGMILFYRSRRETIESNGYRWVTSSKWGYVTWTVKLFRVFEFFILIFVSFLFWILFLRLVFLRFRIFVEKFLIHVRFAMKFIVFFGFWGFLNLKVFSSTKLKFFFFIPLYCYINVYFIF